MKKVKLDLALNKETVANLTNNDMDQVKGGIKTVFCYPKTQPVSECNVCITQTEYRTCRCNNDVM